MDVSFAPQTCLTCEKPLAGRKDKKFCDDYCRATFHNQNRSLGELYIQHVNRVMRHNRKILRTLCPQGKAKVRKDVLEQMGYDFNHFTGIFKGSQAVYYMVYDYGFAPITDNKKQKALIIQRQDYMAKPGFKMWK